MLCAMQLNDIIVIVHVAVIVTIGIAVARIN